MRATSSQRLNLRPTCRSMPTSWNPQRACSARRLARGLDTCEHGVEPAALGDVEQLGQQQAPDALPAPVAPDVDAVLHAGAIGSPFLVGRQGAETDHLGTALGVEILGDDGRERTGSGLEPVLLVLERAGHEIERGGGRQDLVVVDAPDRLGVGEAGGGAARSSRRARVPGVN